MDNVEQYVMAYSANHEDIKKLLLDEGTFFLDIDKNETIFKAVEIINEKKEYCNCSFKWKRPPLSAFGEKDELIKNAMSTPREMVLGAYVVSFARV